MSANLDQVLAAYNQFNQMGQPQPGDPQGTNAAKMAQYNQLLAQLGGVSPVAAMQQFYQTGQVGYDPTSRAYVPLSQGGNIQWTNPQTGQAEWYQTSPNYNPGNTPGMPAAQPGQIGYNPYQQPAAPAAQPQPVVPSGGLQGSLNPTYSYTDAGKFQQQPPGYTGYSYGQGQGYPGQPQYAGYGGYPPTGPASAGPPLYSGAGAPTSGYGIYQGIPQQGNPLPLNGPAYTGYGDLTGGITRTVDDQGNYGPTQINNLTLPGNPQVTPAWYNASLIDRSQVPQTTATTPQQFDALNFLLSGQGYNPDILAKMNAAAVDAQARQAAAQRGSARINAEQAGMVGSPGEQALEAQINRQSGDATTAALNQIAIQNAQQGIQNLTTGAGMELSRQTSASQMMNDAALQNAARLFASMQQNVANQQQASQFNAQQTGQANQVNTQNEINRNLNQAQLQRQGDIYNAGVYENRYGQAFGGMQNLIGGTNPYGYNQAGAQYGSQYNPQMGFANFAGNIASQYGANPYNPPAQQTVKTV